MKLFILSIITAFICNSLIAQKSVTTYYDWNKIHPKEKYTVNSNGQITGSYLQYDQNGVVVSEWNYINGEKNGVCIDYAAREHNQHTPAIKTMYKAGVLDGYYVEFDGNNDYKAKQREGQYRNNLKVGIWKEWWCIEGLPNILKSAGAYSNDGGMYRTGQWIYYYENGNVDSAGSFENDIKVGEWREYSIKGTLISRGLYKNGKKDGSWSVYDPDDSTKIINTGQYDNGIRTGAWNIYFDKDWEETNNKTRFAFYRKIKFDKQGKPTADQVHDLFITGEKQWEGYLSSVNPDIFKGVSVFYYKSGKVEERIDYDKGEDKVYYENGDIKAEGTPSGDKRNGKWKDYYEGGKIKTDAFYVNGQIKGACKSYFPTGQLHFDGQMWFDDFTKIVKDKKGIEYNEDNETISVDGIQTKSERHFGQYEVTAEKNAQMLIFILSDSVGKGKFNFVPFKDAATFSVKYNFGSEDFESEYSILENEDLIKKDLLSDTPENRTARKYPDQIQSVRALYKQSMSQGKDLDIQREITSSLGQIINMGTR